jgi:arylsulfatase A-like enzyme
MRLLFATILLAVITLQVSVIGQPSAAEAQADAPAQPPSIVFILADDMRWNALGCMGDKIVQTPHLDRLAAEGVLFKNSFVTTSICAVSRATIFSGQYARRHGINDFATPLTDEQWAQTYPALLRKGGYRTGFIGKFGVGKDVAPMAKHFDYWKGLPGQAGLFFDPKDPTKTHATARFGEQALEFLKECQPGKPFCLSVSFSAPHARDGQPREFPPDLRDEKLYADAKFPVPKLAASKYFEALPKFVQESEGHKRWQRRFADAEMYQQTVRDYHRLITGVDREVGRIVELLRERKLADNTIIVFTADNGFFLGERGMADKWLPYEESIRVPLIVYDPRLPKGQRGRTVDAMALNLDMAPTLLDYADVKAAEKMQGRSLRPLVEGAKSAAPWRTEWFYEHLTLPMRILPSEGVRTERWKYFRWVGVEPAVEELYDLANDPLEEHNLAAKPEHGKTLSELRERWRRLRQELQ